MNTSSSLYPYKSPAVALLFTVFLGPVGLLYASAWRGALMIALSIFTLSNHFLFVTLLIWLLCCIWGVSVVESFNKKL